MSNTVFGSVQQTFRIGLRSVGLVSLIWGIALLVAHTIYPYPFIANWADDLAFIHYEIWYYGLVPNAVIVFIPFGVLMLAGSLQKTRNTALFGTAGYLLWSFVWTASSNSCCITVLATSFQNLALPLSGSILGIDFRDLALVAILGTTLLATAKGKPLGVLLKTLEGTALALAPLGGIIALIDYREFYIHVTEAQMGTPLQFFTNADLLGSCLAVTLASAALLRRNKNWNEVP